ncbi:MAG: phosphate ABC transporter substrate-binding protein [Clostridia bacterium]|nr:phosphate ABC transporter substrate-binding protein [Clostridia bacterium]
MLKKLFKLSLFLLMGIFVFGLLSGCGTGVDDDQEQDAVGDQNDDRTSGLSGSFTIAGSTSVQPLSEELVKEFVKLNPDVQIDVNGGGSSAGMKLVSEGGCDLGAASRNLKDEELAAGLEPVVIAKDGIAIVVHNDNPISELTVEQIANIYRGEISNWSQLGGEDSEITIVNRDEASGTRGAFHELVVGEENEFTQDAIIQSSQNGVKEAVKGDKNAIGYISMGILDESVKGLIIEGVQPNEENVLSGDYKIARPFNYATNGKPDGLVKEYIDWVLSDHGQDIVAKEYIPIK